jgi:hypothetical protein
MGALGWTIDFILSVLALAGITASLGPVLLAILLPVGCWAAYELYYEQENDKRFIARLRAFLLEVAGAAGAIHWSISLPLSILLLAGTTVSLPWILLIVPAVVFIWATYRFYTGANVTPNNKVTNFLFKCVTKVLGAGGATHCLLALAALAFGAIPLLWVIIVPLVIMTWAGYLLYREYQLETTPTEAGKHTSAIVIEHESVKDDQLEKKTTEVAHISVTQPEENPHVVFNKKPGMLHWKETTSKSANSALTNTTDAPILPDFTVPPEFQQISWNSGRYY